MNKIKKIMILILSVVMLIAGMPSVLAIAEAEEVIEMNGNARMFADSIWLGMDFMDGEVVMSCEVSAPYSTESISLLFVLREENAAGNLVIADTWSDSGSGYDFFNEYSYSPAIEGREYELSVRVGMYDANGLVGYDYKTISAVN